MNVIHPMLLTLIKAVGSPYYFTEAVLTATIPRIGKTDSWPLQTKAHHLHDNPPTRLDLNPVFPHYLCYHRAV